MDKEIKLEADPKVAEGILELVKGGNALDAISNVGFAARALIEAMDKPIEKRVMYAVIESIITKGLPGKEEVRENEKD